MEGVPQARNTVSNTVYLVGGAALHLSSITRLLSGCDKTEFRSQKGGPACVVMTTLPQGTSVKGRGQRPNVALDRRI